MKQNNIHWLLLFTLLGIVFVSGCGTSQVKVDTKSAVSEETIKEICKEIKAYSEYCHNTGIPADDCGTQMAEKIPRLFDITNSQFLHVLVEMPKKC